MIHIAAVSQIRLDTDGRAYYRRKQAADKAELEGLRCLKRRISDALYRQLLADAEQAQERPPDALVGLGVPIRREGRSMGNNSGVSRG